MIDANQMQRNGLHREVGGIRRRWRIPVWRATVDETGHLLLCCRAMIGWRESRLNIPISAMVLGVATPKRAWVIVCEANLPP
jgi:hypothetical protein